MEYELYHYGVPGMRWGVRRYRNKDGSLTDAGEKRLARKANKYYKSKRDEADRNYQNFVTKKFKPVDDPLWDRYMNNDRPGDADKWYKQNVPKDSPYWKLKRQSDQLYNQWKTLDRKTEATLAYVEHLSSNPIKRLTSKTPIVDEGRQYVEAYAKEILNE